MKEPLLAAVVANEPKTSVTNESLNRTARHPSLLGHTCPRSREYQISFQPDILMYGRDFTQGRISSSDNRRELCPGRTKSYSLATGGSTLMARHLRGFFWPKSPRFLWGRAPT